MALIEVTKSAEQKELRARTRLSDKGRLVIPAAMRAELGMVDGELRIATREGRLRRAQEWIRQIVPPGVSLADELSAERREAAKYE
jgi:bifunctional DNA-binding transcriptional regulator/antitoxin component of YhaV-PrlF toxin-antitoxin module